MLTLEQSGGSSQPIGPAAVRRRQRCWGVRQRLYVAVVKSAADCLLAALALIVLSPFLLALAVAVWCSLGRPILFRQQRVGRGGRRFTILKFRTMSPNRRRLHLPAPHPDRRLTHKHEADPRLTRTGRFLRRWSLDELPQLLNVLVGDMSLVGPRPELPEIVSGYQAWKHARHDVRPGLTGLWQVSRRGITPMHECVDTDLEYIRAVGPWIDLRIMARTPIAALGRNRGY